MVTHKECYDLGKNVPTLHLTNINIINAKAYIYRWMFISQSDHSGELIWTEFATETAYTLQEKEVAELPNLSGSGRGTSLAGRTTDGVVKFLSGGQSAAKRSVGRLPTRWANDLVKIAGISWMREARNRSLYTHTSILVKLLAIASRKQVCVA